MFSLSHDFPFYKQLNGSDCGTACLYMITKYYNLDYSVEFIRSITPVEPYGVTLATISKAAQQLGCHTKCVKIPFKMLYEDAPLPLIAHWIGRKFVVQNNRKQS
jgi:ATP-binding cassette, subfamily B, bacterial